MKAFKHILIPALVLTVAVFSPLMADDFLENLQPDQVVHGFRTANLYDNSSGKAMGARFVSEKYGYIVDLVQIQSVPQAFYWIKTPITSSKGEPHACEHLLLGKGNRGRHVAALEDMALANSTAYTQQYRTCYHFNTTAGDDTFYELFEAKLQALLHPDFADEEIRREVCHIGVNVDPQSGEMSLDEKGTVYTEMVSSFERPWYHIYGALNLMIYGEDHPLTNVSGGDPDVMRSMVPEDMWEFHKKTHHLGNMGVIVSIPDDISIESFLKRTDEILNRCQDYADSDPLPGMLGYNFPPARPAPEGTMKLVTYPSDKPQDPGTFIVHWPAILKLSYLEESALQLFLETFAGGETSTLYDLFVNSETRVIDLGGNSVSGWVDDDMDGAIGFDVTGVDNANITETMVDSVRSMIVSAIRRIHDLSDDSEELKDFNKRARSHLEQQRKQVANHLNQPPMFGFRSGPAGAWLNMMRDLEKRVGFRKSLVYAEDFAYADSLLSLDKNIWKDFIDDWQLLTVQPFALGASPSPDIVPANQAAKEARLAGYVEDFKKEFGTQDAQLAVAKYKEKFDAKTAELEALAGHDDLPGFIDNPPMTLDDQLKYETVSLPGDIPMVASTFDNMTSSRVGLALSLDVIPESLLVYTSLLPSLLTDIGVVKDGQVVKYDDMQESLRKEVLNFGSYFTTSIQRGRVELVLYGDGGNRDELFKVLDWMDASLNAPYLATDNLARMTDVVDQSLLRFRNRTKASEESWVQNPSSAFRMQENPLYMATSCFFTQTHNYQRLKWMLTDPGGEDQQQAIRLFIDDLAEQGKGKTREGLTEMLSQYEDTEATSEVLNLAGLNDDGRQIAREIAQAFKVTLGDIPDANLAEDWAYLCDETRADLMVKPEATLAKFDGLLNLIRKAGNARMYLISNTADRAAIMPEIEKLVGKLDADDAPQHQQYADIQRVTQRLASREPGLEDPLYVGLVHEGTQNGVLMFSAKVADEYDTSRDKVLDCLSGKLYGGGGPHGIFMNTWAAGLAYSNGYGYSQGNGRCSYYAERCPDVAETMRFVVGLLKDAEDNPELVDYAVAQVFGYSRAPSRYEQRGQAMAADLTDGFTAEKVRQHRQTVLAMRDDPNLYTQLKERMEEAYGPVLIGYGAPLSQSEDGNFFLIGPEKQFTSLENYIAQVESPQKVYRLYARDFWLTD